MGLLQPRLKVVCYSFFYCRWILVVFCRAVAIPGPEGEAPPPDKIRSFSFENCDKEGKNTRN